MTGCNQKKCRWTAWDLSHDGKTVCSAPCNEMVRLDTGRSFILYCSAYRRRETWNPSSPDEGIPDLHHMTDADGLYPGQIKPPTDYTDVDPDELYTDTTDVTSNEPECDT